MYQRKIDLSLRIIEALPKEALGNSATALEAAKKWIADHEAEQDNMDKALVELRLTGALENIVTVAFVRGVLTSDMENEYRDIISQDTANGYKDLVVSKTDEVNKIANEAQTLVKEWNEKQQAISDMFGKPQQQTDADNTSE